MEPTKWKKVYQRSEGELDGQLSKEQRDQKKKRLFMQQFEKEAQERIREMELKVEQLLATVDRAFRVELMKLPPQLQGTRLKDLMRENDEAAGEVTIAMKAESPEIHRPLTRKTSKKGQAKENATRRKRMLSTQNKTPLPAVSKKTAKSRSLADLDPSASKSQRSCSTSNFKRTRGCVAKANDLVALSTDQKRSTNLLGLSPNPFVTATATILTSHGEALCLSDEIKDDIDVDMLDDTAVHQMRKLMRLMDYLCNKAKVNNDQ
ncbi:borealin-2 isoform X1 [Anguilla anguilla]|uniref:borealin-2 isoform X1 n=1 Tax=Anguilla anguilla TaxID=7936 RepID=UPI0015B0C816|nr:borealin-2 isoform X1 [Anguilla anguilla]